MANFSSVQNLLIGGPHAGISTGIKRAPDRLRRVQRVALRVCAQCDLASLDCEPRIEFDCAGGYQNFTVTLPKKNRPTVS